MTQLADEVVVAADAQIYVADVGSTAPTDATTAPDGAFVDLGYVSEDGFDLSDAATLQSVRAMQSFYDLRKIVESKEFTLGFSMMQWNEDTVSLALGGASVSDEGGGVWHIEPPDVSVIDERAYIFDWQDGDNNYRLYLAKAQMTSGLTAKFARTAAAALPIVVTATPISTSDNAWDIWIESTTFGS